MVIPVETGPNNTRQLGRVALLTLLFLAELLLSFPASADADRVALVVGNSGYQHMPILEDPGADAKAVADVLGQLGFENGRVEPLLDLDLRKLLQAVRVFGERARDAKVAVVYFSGHGLQLSQGDGTESYLLPVDADLGDARDVPHQALALHELLGEAGRTQGGVVVLLDACRNNPAALHMAGVGSRGVARSGLIPIAQSSLPLGVLVSYATSGGDAAEDGFGRHSPYATALIKYLSMPEHDVGQVLRRVRADVLQSTGGKQKPEIVDNLNGDLFLAPGREAPRPAPGREDVPGATVQSAPLSDLAAETALWTAVRDSNRQEDLEAYLRRFPQGLYADLARNRLSAMTRPGPQSLLTPPPPLQAPAATQPAAIKGVVVTYSGDGWPMIDGRIVRLSGIKAVSQERMKKFVIWLTRQQGYLVCEPKIGDEYRCLTSENEDLAQALLMNGQARASLGADAAYLAAEQQAQAAKRGIWR
jgi:uncharacterized caspase-like protein/endonuclease YncB( thermonuclease family)